MITYDKIAMELTYYLIDMKQSWWYQSCNSVALGQCLVYSSSWVLPLTLPRDGEYSAGDLNEVSTHFSHYDTVPFLLEIKWGNGEWGENNSSTRLIFFTFWVFFGMFYALCNHSCVLMVLICPCFHCYWPFPNQILNPLFLSNSAFF